MAICSSSALGQFEHSRWRSEHVKDIFEFTCHSSHDHHIWLLRLCDRHERFLQILADIQASKLRTHWSQWPRVTWMQHLGDWAHHFKKSSTPPCNHLFSKLWYNPQICVDLCKDRLSELLDQVENRGAPVDPVYTAVTKGRGPTPEEAARASAKLLVSAALLSSGVLVEAPETVGFTTQSTQTVTVPVPAAPVPVVPVAPSATAATVATAAATASITSHSATCTPATAAKAAAPMAPSPVAKKATPVPKAAQAAQAFKAMPQKAPPLQPQAAQAASPLPVPKPKVEPRKSFAEQVAVGVSSIFGKSTPPKAKKQGKRSDRATAKRDEYDSEKLSSGGKKRRTAQGRQRGEDANTKAENTRTSFHKICASIASENSAKQCGWRRRS